MKTILQILLAIFCASGVSAQTQIVVPGGLENMEGNSSSADLFINGEARMLQVYPAFDFRTDAPQLRINGMSFRLDETAGVTLGSWSVSVFVSTTTRGPESLIPSYSGNHGSDGVLAVTGGGTGIVSMETGPGPRTFRLDIPFMTPFFYDPSQGNLAVSIVASGRGSLRLDAQNASDDGIGRVFGPNEPNGTVDTLGLVTRFDITPIPEPATLTLFLFLGGLWSFATRKIQMFARNENQ